MPQFIINFFLECIKHSNPEYPIVALTMRHEATILRSNNAHRPHICQARLSPPRGKFYVTVSFERWPYISCMTFQKAEKCIVYSVNKTDDMGECPLFNNNEFGIIKFHISLLNLSYLCYLYLLAICKS